MTKKGKFDFKIEGDIAQIYFTGTSAIIVDLDMIKGTVKFINPTTMVLDSLYDLYFFCSSIITINKKYQND